MKTRRDLVLALVDVTEGLYTDHARADVERLGLTWEDVISVVRTSDWHHQERDEMRESRMKDSFIGRDTRGRRLYLTGKEMRDLGSGETVWLVITFHEANQV